MALEISASLSDSLQAPSIDLKNFEDDLKIDAKSAVSRHLSGIFPLETHSQGEEIAKVVIKTRNVSAMLSLITRKILDHKSPVAVLLFKGIAKRSLQASDLEAAKRWAASSTEEARSALEISPRRLRLRKKIAGAREIIAQFLEQID